MTVPIELIFEHASATPFRRSVIWQQRDRSGGVATNLDPWFSSFGAPSIEAVTLGRIGVGCFIADRGTPRNKLRQRREITLFVRVPDPDLAEQAKGPAQRLLTFVTGDDWELAFEADDGARPDSVGEWPQAEQVALLSGGMDSFCGALLADPTVQLYLSHSDAPVTTHSQTRSSREIPGFEPTRHVQVSLQATESFDREPSRRSRSILFMMLAVALADAQGVPRVEVPENGFTSLNPPLAANRGGVLTTRSTHPTTFQRGQELIDALGLPIRLSNPYQWVTKGELLSLARDAQGVDVVQRGLATSLSCAKSNLVLPNSGSGRNCGLDYACLVRRGAAIAAGVEDTSNYVCHDVQLAAEVAALRRADIRAVKRALEQEPSVVALSGACGPFPDGYDYEEGVDLWRRGLDELAGVQLP